MTTCDGEHAAPTCDDPACYREKHARRADDALPGLGDLVRSGQLDPDSPTSVKLGNVDGAGQWADRAEVLDANENARGWRVATVPPARSWSVAGGPPSPFPGWRSCNRTHAAPPCDDPACYCEEHASRADAILPGLGDFVRRGDIAPNLWIWIGDSPLPPLRDTRSADPANPTTTDRLTDEELASWARNCRIDEKSMEGTYLRFLVDELQDRRAAEAAFAEVDDRFQALECEACDDLSGSRLCPEHEVLAKQWRRARDELLEQARIHRGYLLDGVKVLLGKVPP